MTFNLPNLSMSQAANNSASVTRLTTEVSLANKEREDMASAQTAKVRLGLLSILLGNLIFD